MRNAYTRKHAWTDADDQRLIRMARQGLHSVAIGKALGRSPRSVESRGTRLGWHVTKGGRRGKAAPPCTMIAGVTGTRAPSPPRKFSWEGAE